MAISIGLISQGLSLLTLILKKVWRAEEGKKKTGKDKHAYVKGYIAAYLKNHEFELYDVDSFIDDVITLFNKHRIFTTKGDD